MTLNCETSASNSKCGGRKSVPAVHQERVVPTRTPIVSTASLTPVQEMWDTLTILDGQLDRRYRDVIDLSRSLPLEPGDQIGPQMVESVNTWVGDTIRQLVVTPTLGDDAIVTLVNGMLNRAKKVQTFITTLRPHLGVSLPAATDVVIDTSKLYFDSPHGQNLIKISRQTLHTPTQNQESRRCCCYVHRRCPESCCEKFTPDLQHHPRFIVGNVGDEFYGKGGNAHERRGGDNKEISKGHSRRTESV
jgi:hypothetical protein